MTEPEVIGRVRSFLQSEVLPSGESVPYLFTDAHHTLLEHGGLNPYQRVTLEVGGAARHPDLAGWLDDGESLLAVEAKGTGDLLKGTAQAEAYQDGFHYSLLAAPAGRISEPTVDRLKQKNIGVLAVSDEARSDEGHTGDVRSDDVRSDDVRALFWPRARQPWRDSYQSVRRQLNTGVRANEWSTFAYNLPTHYLAWAIALEPGTLYNTSQFPGLIEPYDSMPKDWKAALRGAETLGLVRVSGDSVRLTPTGAATGDIIGASLPEWNGIHPKAIRSTLAGVVPRAGAALRILLLREPMVRLVIRGLKERDGEASMPRLARACDALNHDRTPALFFHPRRGAEILDDHGQVQWDRVEPAHYRSTTFYQMKSILKHAGILEDTGLGGSSVKNYDPAGDVWKLRDVA